MRKMMMALVLSFMPAFAQEVVVSGRATIQKSPELATLSLDITGRAGNADDAQAKVAKVLDEVRMAAAQISGVKFDVREYTVGEDVQYSEGGKYTHNGYVATVHADVKINDLAMAQKALGLAEIKGVTALTSLTFDVKDRGKAEVEAIAAALKVARAKGEAMALAIGKNSAELLRIQEQNVYFSDPFYLNGSIPNSFVARGLAGGALLAAESSDFLGGRKPQPYVTPAKIEISGAVVVLVTLK